jgi:2',3'-cyclic-nucleotide 2'-phosphodiesterase (5'-nucleotidase family)
MGLGEDLRTGEVSSGQVPHENEAVSIAKQVPGVDVIFMGHTHREVPSLFINGVLLTQANHWGRHLARADVYLQKEPTGWRVYAKSARTLATDDRVEPDPSVIALAEPYDRETQGWLARVIGQSAEDLNAREARFRDTAILDLIQKVQMDVGKADVSMVASFNPEARIAKGPVSVRDIAGLYVYENTLVVLEVTGQQLKETDRRKNSRLQFRHRRRSNVRARHHKTDRAANSESSLSWAATFASAKTSSRHEQLSRERRRWLHDVQGRSGFIPIRRRDSRHDYRLGRAQQNRSHDAEQ